MCSDKGTNPFITHHEGVLYLILLDYYVISLVFFVAAYARIFLNKDSRARYDAANLRKKNENVHYSPQNVTESKQIIRKTIF